jgi:hypothetical protein
VFKKFLNVAFTPLAGRAAPDSPNVKYRAWNCDSTWKRTETHQWRSNDLKKLANDILHADSEAEMYRLLAPLTAEETDTVAQLVEMAAAKAWAERERAKSRPKSELTWFNCVSEIGLLGRL